MRASDDNFEMFDLNQWTLPLLFPDNETYLFAVHLNAFTQKKKDIIKAEIILVM